MKKLIGLFLILFLSSTVLIAQENRTAKRGADMKAMQERMISELMKGGVPCPEPVRDVKALLPTTAQSSYVPAVASYPQPPVYAESEEVTDEPPREMTKADMQREQIIRALRRNNGRRREAAAELFMSERTLYRKIKELGIEDN